jgi:hypothetical protein
MYLCIFLKIQVRWPDWCTNGLLHLLAGIRIISVDGVCFYISSEKIFRNYEIACMHCLIFLQNIPSANGSWSILCMHSFTVRLEIRYANFIFNQFPSERAKGITKQSSTLIISWKKNSLNCISDIKHQTSTFYSAELYTTLPMGFLWNIHCYSGH